MTTTTDLYPVTNDNAASMGAELATEALHSGVLLSREAFERDLRSALALSRPLSRLTESALAAAWTAYSQVWSDALAAHARYSVRIDRTVEGSPAEAATWSGTLDQAPQWLFADSVHDQPTPETAARSVRARVTVADLLDWYGERSTSLTDGPVTLTVTLTES